ncbi:MAG TPA: hypothetical protein VFI02_13260 [Armatimonadota bacterium]|nr:hypothetical protein [Armatimonadota bacterium]
MSEECKLQVDRAELIEALAQISRLRHRISNTRVKLLYENGELVFALRRFRTRVAAKGVWQGEPSVPISWLRKLANVPPSEDPVKVRYSDARVAIGEGSSPVCA